MRARSAMAVAALTALVLTLPVTTASATPATPRALPVGPGQATAPGAFVPIGLTRALDTRSDQENPAGAARKLQPGESFDVPLSAWQNHPPRELPVVPADATAVVVNVTATNTTAAGYLTVRRDGAVPGAPVTSTLNFEAGETVSNMITVAVDPRGANSSPQINVYNNAGTTDVVVDILGYYAPSTPQRPGHKYDPVRPTRLADTRVEGGRLGRGGVVTADVARRDLGTADATAVVLNVTAVDPSTEGFVVAHPTSWPLPAEGSHLNYGPGRTVANQVVVPVGPEGTIEFFNTGSTDLVVDIVGYYGPSGHNLYSAVTEQARLLDTRPGAGAWAFSTLEFPVAGRSGVPDNATAVTLNVTATEPQADGHLAVFAADGTAARPSTSNLNFNAGRTVANGVAAQLGGNPGSVAVYHHAAGFTQVIADLTGWFVQG
ncbi:hypothetical protein [Kitasatospora sp. MBT66]|uniref:hypothetical protein n=1 Tax=Kitasatospora sp. MBT66 TaxID=1444769 RepID=UPI0005B79D21|nr:hypothetical protein [Kitasatospora sp. MBT66]